MHTTRVRVSQVQAAAAAAFEAKHGPVRTRCGVDDACERKLSPEVGIRPSPGCEEG